MDPTHTPGPWEVKQAINTRYGEQGDCAIVIAGTKIIIAEAFRRVDTARYEDAAANAALMAAAPDLLEVLTKARKVMENVTVLFAPQYLLHTDALFKEIDTAIAKASGRRCNCGALLTDDEVQKGGWTCLECHAREAEVS